MTTHNQTPRCYDNTIKYLTFSDLNSNYPRLKARGLTTLDLKHMFNENGVAKINGVVEISIENPLGIKFLKGFPTELVAAIARFRVQLTEKFGRVYLKHENQTSP